MVAGVTECWTLIIEETFDAAHQLTKMPVGHKCRNLHGHTWTVRAYLSRGELNSLDMVIDFSVAKAALHEVIQHLDHSVVNDWMPPDVQPTCEALAKEIHQALRIHLAPTVYINFIEVQETPGNLCRYHRIEHAAPDNVSEDPANV